MKKSLTDFLKALYAKYNPYIFEFRNDAKERETEGRAIVREIAELNLRRIVPMSFLFIVAVVVYFALEMIVFFPRMPRGSFLLIEALTLICSGGYIKLASAALEGKGRPLRTLRLIYRSYWAVFLILAIAYFLLDAYLNQKMMDNISLYIIMAVFPLLTLKEAVFYMLPLNIITAAGAFSGLVPLENALSTSLMGTVFGIVGAFFLYSSTYRRISLEKRLARENKKLEAMSVTDSLTGLQNRWGLEQFVSRLWSGGDFSGEEMSVVIIDIDYFKAFNDLFGHCRGDECLCGISAVIHDVFREYAGVIARIGGEEFLVVLRGVAREKTEELVLEMRREIETLKIPAGNKKVSEIVTVSVGIAISDQIGEKNWNDYYAKADKALYEAKKMGRNRVVEII